ncbi:MAG: hypothetical protein KF889_03860 [Alphaproteobacteria bacterium]|nr:hypothetical protein [Alphaproteobacteria bacterium]
MPVSNIPEFNVLGLLPAWIGSPTTLKDRSPYEVSMSQVVDRFGKSRQRLELLDGLVKYRQALFSSGFVVGYQWLNGSFVEDVEKTRGRAPGDIDIVTLFRRPIKYQVDPKAWAVDVAQFTTMLSPRECKTRYHCEAFPIDLDKPAEKIVEDVTYWFSLFSHQRITDARKGMLLVRLATTPSDGINEAQLVQQAKASLDG